MTAVAAFREPGGTNGPFDPDTGTYPTTPHEPYLIRRCRVQALATGANRMDVAEDVVTVAGYLVTVPLDTPGLEVGHLIRVTESGDPLLEVGDLRVDDIVRGSLLVERDLFCTFNESEGDA